MLTVQTIESFTRYEFAAPMPAVTNPIEPGIKHRLQIHRDSRRRFIWIAAGAFVQFDKAQQWFLQGALNFFLNGTKTGSFQFCDASSELAAAARAEAPRTVTRIRADGSGSVQPTLRYQEIHAPTYTRDNLDISCFEVFADADTVEYELERSYLDINAIALGILTGLRVLSTS